MKERGKHRYSRFRIKRRCEDRSLFRMFKAPISFQDGRGEILAGDAIEATISIEGIFGGEIGGGVEKSIGGDRDAFVQQMMPHMVGKLAGPFEPESGEIRGQVSVLKRFDVVGLLRQIFA
jgi:hypothetical protein